MSLSSSMFATMDRMSAASSAAPALPSTPRSDNAEDPFRGPFSGPTTPRAHCYTKIPPPRTPPPRLTTSGLQWSKKLSREKHPLSAGSNCSSFADFSDTDSGNESDGGSCTTADDEEDVYQPKNARQTRSGTFVDDSDDDQPRKVRWSLEADNHLWSTFQHYQEDPTVTPYQPAPNGVPPLGVCHRVARVARRTWRETKNPLRSGRATGRIEKRRASRASRFATPQRQTTDASEAILRSAGLDSVLSRLAELEETPRPRTRQSPNWPASASDTRRRLRLLCRRKMGASTATDALKRASMDQVKRRLFDSEHVATTIATIPPSSLLGEPVVFQEKSTRRREDTDLEDPFMSESTGRAPEDLNEQPRRSGLMDGFRSPRYPIPPRRSSISQTGVVPVDLMVYQLSEHPGTSALKRRAERTSDEDSPPPAGESVRTSSESVRSVHIDGHRRTRSRGEALVAARAFHTRRAASLATLTGMTNPSELEKAHDRFEAALNRGGSLRPQSSAPALLGSPFIENEIGLMEDEPRRDDKPAGKRRAIGRRATVGAVCQRFWKGVGLENMASKAFRNSHLQHSQVAGETFGETTSNPPIIANASIRRKRNDSKERDEEF